MVPNKHPDNYLETIGGCEKIITLVNAEEERLTTFSESCCVLSNFNYKPETKSVFIKPDIGRKANIDPELVKWIIHCLKEFGIEDIMIREGSAGTEYENTPYNFDYDQCLNVGFTKI